MWLLVRAFFDYAEFAWKCHAKSARYYEKQDHVDYTGAECVCKVGCVGFKRAGLNSFTNLLGSGVARCGSFSLLATFRHYIRVLLVSTIMETVTCLGNNAILCLRRNV